MREFPLPSALQNSWIWPVLSAHSYPLSVAAQVQPAVPLAAWNPCLPHSHVSIAIQKLN